MATDDGAASLSSDGASSPLFPDITATVIEISPDTEEREKGAFRNVKKPGGAKKKRSRRYSSVEIWTADEKELKDDECCIVASTEEIDLTLPIKDPDEDNDVAVLAVRGKMACRDYPHARHSCGEYPFSETSHEDCCPQCYCYVCDVSAPCSHWKGSDGHCHAFSGDTKWDGDRLAFRLTKMWR